MDSIDQAAREAAEKWLRRLEKGEKHVGPSPLDTLQALLLSFAREHVVDVYNAHGPGTYHLVRADEPVEMHIHAAGEEPDPCPDMVEMPVDPTFEQDCPRCGFVLMPGCRHACEAPPTPAVYGPGKIPGLAPFAPTTDAERERIQKDLHDVMRKRLTPENDETTRAKAALQDIERAERAAIASVLKSQMEGDIDLDKLPRADTAPPLHPPRSGTIKVKLVPKKTKPPVDWTE